MADRIASLCARLLESKETVELRRVADDLRSAIHDHIDGVRETACGIWLLDRIMSSAVRRSREIHKSRPRPEYRESD
jgi:hypothetical protein